MRGRDRTPRTRYRSFFQEGFQIHQPAAHLCFIRKIAASYGAISSFCSFCCLYCLSLFSFEYSSNLAFACIYFQASPRVSSVELSLNLHTFQLLNLPFSFFLFPPVTQNQYACIAPVLLLHCGALICLLKAFQAIRMAMERSGSI